MSHKFAPEECVTIDYTNWRGVRSVRKIVPVNIIFCSNQWHPEEQWLVYAWDEKSQDMRFFAMNDIHSWEGAKNDAARRSVDVT